MGLGLGEGVTQRNCNKKWDMAEYSILGCAIFLDDAITNTRI
jgi:hypothetical protein